MPMRRWDKRTRSYRHHTTYSIWYQVVRRCTDPTHHSYDDYGGRGIKVQEDWVPHMPQRSAALAFRNFCRDVGLRPSQSVSLDRIDPNGNYIRDNVRWATVITQARNKRDTIYIMDPDPPYQQIPVALLAERLGLRYQTLRYRLKKANLWPGDLQPSDIATATLTEEDEIIAEAIVIEASLDEDEDTEDA